MGTKHSATTIAKITAGQHSPVVRKLKSDWCNKYWEEVRAGIRPPRRKPTGRPRTPVTDRFWAKVIKKPNGCWIFNSTHGAIKYGMLSVPAGQEYLAHRISWTMQFGTIPDGMLVLHRCDNPKCVNPKHLFLGTAQDNMDDMVTKGRSLKGEDHPQSVLTESIVKQIRRLYRSGKCSQSKLGEIFGVSQTNIGFIVRRVSWKHVD